MLQAIINGILTGCMYGVSALGLSIIYGVTNVCNFAHGAIIMIGMYVTYFLWTILQVEVYALIIPTFIIMFFIGALMQRVIVKPVMKSKTGAMNVIFATTCLGWILENVILLIFGSNYKIVESGVKTASWVIGDIVIVQAKLFGALAAILITLLLHLFLKKTDIGRSIRATSQNKEAALTMGINSEKMFRIAFGLGCGVAGLAGLLFLPYFYCTPTVGHTFTTKAFIIVVLGGMGDINGALLGGIIIGIIETIGTLYLETSTVNMIVFAVFILFLIFRPTGLLGKKEA